MFNNFTSIQSAKWNAYASQAVQMYHWSIKKNLRGTTSDVEEKF